MFNQEMQSPFRTFLSLLFWF